MTWHSDNKTEEWMAWKDADHQAADWKDGTWNSSHTNGATTGEWKAWNDSDHHLADWKDSNSWSSPNSSVATTGEWKALDDDSNPHTADWKEPTSWSSSDSGGCTSDWKAWNNSDHQVADWKETNTWSSSHNNGAAQDSWSTTQEKHSSSYSNQWHRHRSRSRSGWRGSHQRHNASDQQGSSWHDHDWQGSDWQNRGWQDRRKQKRNNSWRERPDWKDEPLLSEELLEELKGKLTHLAPGSRVAIISLQGSLCPITQSHVACCVEARKILMSHSEQSDRHDGLAGLETFSEIIGFIGCNSDSHVSGKLSKLDPPFNQIIPWKDRKMLVELATQEYDWLHAVSKPFEATHELQSLYNDLHIKFFEVVGADNVLSEKKWRRVNDNERLIIMGRASDPEKDNGTDAVYRAMQKDRQTRDDLKDKNFDFLRSTPWCIWGPELPAVSSTAVRHALHAGDEATLSTMLHPAVQEWNLNEGPYARP